jgi:tetratricopeptide (TPR) repeat protein
MAKKSKKSRKLRKNKQSKLLNMTDPQRIDSARQKLENNNARDAISILKMVNNQSNDVSELLFNAYMMRESQLKSKGMHIEAQAILEQAFDYLPNFSTITEDSLCLYIKKSTINAAVDAYYSYRQKQKISKKAQFLLVDRIMMTGQWQLLDIFEKNDLILKDLSLMKKTRQLMVDGKWEDAYQAMKPLPRLSPYAEYKLFCRGMVAFYADNESEMLQAFNRISKDFSLYPTIKELMVIASPMESLKKKGYSISKTDHLWDGPAHLDRQIGQMISAADDSKKKELQTLILSVAKALYPDKPDWAAFHILMLLLLRQIVQQESIHLITDVASVILNKKQYQLFTTKYKYQYGKHPFLNAARYLDCLSTEYKRPESQSLAKAMILFQTARRWFKNKDSLLSTGLKYLSKELDLKYSNNEELLISLVCKGLSFDPINRKGYELLVEFPRTGRMSKNLVEEYLLIMREKMENDPVPCLELADLYYEKNAFRKAETVLKEAMKRAPHDNRVIERHVIALLISADKNFSRNKMHLAAPDILKARQVDCKSLLPYVIERTILYDLINKSDQLKEVTENFIQSLNIAEAIRCMSLLYLEKDRLPRSMKGQFKEMLISMHEKILTLTGSEILFILRPIPKKMKTIFKVPAIVSLYENLIPKIFKCMDDTEVIALFDILLSPMSSKIILKEIKRRFHSAAPDRQLMLSFYQIAIWHLDDKKNSPGMFINIVDQAKGPVLEEMRELSKRLAQHASGSLKRALESLDFSLLGMPIPHFMDKRDSDGFDFDYDDGEDDEQITKKNLHDSELDEEYDDEDDFDDFFDFDFDSDDDLGLFGFNNMIEDMILEAMEERIDTVHDVRALKNLIDKIEIMPKPHLIEKAVDIFEDILEVMGFFEMPPQIIPKAHAAMEKFPGMKNIMKRLAKIVNKHHYKDLTSLTRRFLERS